MRSPSASRPIWGMGADRQHDGLGLDRAAAAGLEVDHDLGRCLALFQLRRALDDLDLVLLHQEADAAVQLFGDVARPLDDGVKVETDLVGGKPIVLEVAQALVFLTRLQKGLGGDTAPVQADAAQVLALEDSDLLAQLAGANGRHIAARARADDDEIEGISHGVVLTPASSRGFRSSA